MKIALIQMEILEKNTETNIRHGIQLVKEAAGKCDIIVLPEIWSTGYALGKIKEECSELGDELIANLKNIAKESKTAIIAGSLPLNRDGKIYNSSIAINKVGEIVNIYDKAHLFGLFSEEKFFAPGNNFSAFDLDGVCCGSTICYDLRFPELYRHLSLQGAKIIFVPAEWPAVRGDMWKLLSQARAAENHNFIVAVNCAGEFKGANFFGNSMVIDPAGKIIAEGSDKEEIIYCDIDLAKIDKVRTHLNALADVRKELIK